MDDAVGIDDVAGMGGGGRDAEGGGSVEVLVDGVCIGGSGVLLSEGDVEDAVDDGGGIGLEKFNREDNSECGRYCGGSAFWATAAFFIASNFCCLGYLEVRHIVSVNI